MRNGFTLVELLSVIVIISLISLISIISVTGIMTKSKNDLYNDQMLLIEKAAKSWGSENIDKLPDKDECIYLTLGSLKTYGILGESIVDPRNNEQISNNLKIKISFTKTIIDEDTEEVIKQYKDYVMHYKVDAKDTIDCRYIYGDYTLIEGESFNQRIKNFANENETIIDSTIKSVVFLNAGVMPDNIESSRLVNSIDLSAARDGSVLGYFVDNTFYIYADGELQSNAISDKMFYNLTALEAVDFTGLNTENVVSMNSMFENCYSLRYLDLSNFDTGSTLNINSMFENCSMLKDLNISSFILNRVNSTDGSHIDVFKNCNNLNIVVNSSIKDFITQQLTTDNVEVNLTIK